MRVVQEDHNGPHECGRGPCDIPGCGARKYQCCSHCPVEYRRRQAAEKATESGRYR